MRGSVTKLSQDENNIISSVFNVPPKDNTVGSICKYELVSGSQIIQTEIEDFKVRLYESSNLAAILKDISFFEVKIHKAFDANEIPSKDDGVIVYECKK